MHWVYTPWGYPDIFNTPGTPGARAPPGYITRKVLPVFTGSTQGVTTFRVHPRVRSDGQCCPRLRLGVQAVINNDTDIHGQPLKAQKIFSGNIHRCAVLLVTGAVLCWGHNHIKGQLGYGSTETIGDQPGEMGDFLPSKHKQ